jgi:hypothetical protein
MAQGGGDRRWTHLEAQLAPELRRHRRDALEHDDVCVPKQPLQPDAGERRAAALPLGIQARRQDADIALAAAAAAMAATVAVSSGSAAVAAPPQ